jgi:hypothetical protein
VRDESKGCIVSTEVLKVRRGAKSETAARRETSLSQRGDDDDAAVTDCCC